MKRCAFLPSAFSGSPVSGQGKSISTCPSSQVRVGMPFSGNQPAVCTAGTSNPGPVVKPSEQEGKAPVQPPVKPKDELLYDVKVFLVALSQALQNTLHSMFGVAKQWKISDASETEMRYTYEDYPGGEDGVLPRKVKGLPKKQGFTPATVGMLAKRAFEYVTAQMPFIARFGTGSLDFRDPNSMWRDLPLRDIFRSVFSTTELLQKPRFLTNNHWCSVEDEIFTSQFINGCHPVVLEHVVDDSKFSRIPDEFNKHRTDDGRTIQQLYKDGCLFITDYEIISREGVADSQKPHASGAYTRTFKGPKPMTKYFYAPFVVLYRDCQNTLQLLGIMLKRSGPGKRDIYSKKTCMGKPNTYMFAKMHVACSDNQLHQFASHLAGHLIWEPFSIAHQNIFNVKNTNHVVGKLLGEHFEGTIAINWLARETLIASRDDMQPLTDAPFAVGAQGASALLAHTYGDWDFKKVTFPQMLKDRGFTENKVKDGLSEFFYRDDGMRLWKALEKYVDAVIEKEYGCGPIGDIKVQQDKVLGQWCKELREEANIRTFHSKFESKKQLTEAITTIIFHVSAQHAALNFPQYEYLSYVPNRPNALFKPVPPLNDSGQDMERDEIFQIWNLGGAAEPLTFMHFQVQFAYILSTPSPTSLMNMHSKFPAEFAELKKDFERLSESIQTRCSKVQYHYLDPKNVPPSINI